MTKTGRSALVQVLPRSEQQWLQRRSPRLLGTEFYIPNIDRGWQDRQVAGESKAIAQMGTGNVVPAKVFGTVSFSPKAHFTKA